ncbi:ANTAR domain-containing protein [Streptomyces sp. NPDC048111]|uniref:ANTAR domain-containing protein n=1 Tax=Streptomyces sp. NPDC048111 TaxID=3365500 RepID=UPI003714F036
MPHCEWDGAGQAGACTRLAEFTGTHQLSGLTVFSRPDGDRTVVSVCGEFDVATGQAVRDPSVPRPSATDDAAQPGLDGVELSDRSAVNLLVIVKETALDSGDRAADLDEALVSVLVDDDPPTVRDTQRLELQQLRRAMRSRGTIDMARGILMAAFGLSPDAAWEVLVSTSQHTNTKLRRLAEQVVASAGGTPLPDAVRKHLSTAVAGLSGPGK